MNTITKLCIVCVWGVCVCVCVCVWKRRAQARHNVVDFQLNTTYVDPKYLKRCILAEIYTIHLYSSITKMVIKVNNNYIELMMLIRLFEMSSKLQHACTLLFPRGNPFYEMSCLHLTSHVCTRESSSNILRLLDNRTTR